MNLLQACFFLNFCDKKVCRFEVFQSKKVEIIFFFNFCDKKVCRFQEFQSRISKVIFSDFLWQKRCRFQECLSRKGKVIFSDFLWQKVCRFQVFRSKKIEINWIFSFFVTKKCADLKYFRVEKAKHSGFATKERCQFRENGLVAFQKITQGLNLHGKNQIWIDFSSL